MLGGGNGFPLRLVETDDALVVPASNGESADGPYLNGVELCGTAGGSAHDPNFLAMIPPPSEPRSQNRDLGHPLLWEREM